MSLLVSGRPPASISVFSRARTRSPLPAWFPSDSVTSPAAGDRPALDEPRAHQRREPRGRLIAACQQQRGFPGRRVGQPEIDRVVIDPVLRALVHPAPGTVLAPRGQLSRPAAAS